jgi:S-adenosylmethionine-diacylgycerolhomoserine-N-methlytransferase
MVAFMSINSTTEHDSSDRSHKLLMDRMYSVQRHIYDITRAYYLLGRDHLIAHLAPSKESHILEIGCGTGRNIIKTQQYYPDAQIYGVDISDEMLRTATSKIARLKLQKRIVLAQADAVTFKNTKVFHGQTFDRIYFSYTLSMIPNWQGALRNAALMLSPKGEIHIVDFGQCESLSALAKRGLQSWLRLFHVTPRAALMNLDLPELEIATTRSLFKGYAWHLTLRRQTTLS